MILISISRLPKPTNTEALVSLREKLITYCLTLSEHSIFNIKNRSDAEVIYPIDLLELKEEDNTVIEIDLQEWTAREVNNYSDEVQEVKKEVVKIIAKTLVLVQSILIVFRPVTLSTGSVTVYDKRVIRKLRSEAINDQAEQKIEHKNQR
jgi:hypothetical protein